MGAADPPQRGADAAELTCPEVAARVVEGALLIVPVGSCEQHGAHLPLTTDTDIAVGIAAGVRDRLPQVVVGPAVTLGSSGEHDGFAGTLSIGQRAVELLLVEVGRSAGATFARTLLLSAHGGNAEPVARAVATLRAEGRDVRSWSPSFGGDAHAGRTETSLLLHLRPEAVRTDRLAAGATAPLGELLPALRSGGVRSVSPNGVLGDPSGANVDEGAALLTAAVDDLATVLRAWLDDRPGAVAHDGGPIGRSGAAQPPSRRSSPSAACSPPRRSPRRWCGSPGPPGRRSRARTCWSTAGSRCDAPCRAARAVTPRAVPLRAVPLRAEAPRPVMPRRACAGGNAP